MNKGISLALLVIGVLLLVWGINASDSFGSQVSETVNGAPANKTIWLIVGGVVAGLAGLGSLVFGRRQS